MALESNIFQWIGSSIEMTLNTYVQVTSSNVITSFVELFVLMGALTFVLMGFGMILGYVEAPFSNFMKTSAKFLIIGGLALSAPLYMSWVVDTLRGLEAGVADAFSASGNAQAATTIYEVLDQVVTNGFSIGADMLEKMGTRAWHEFGMMFFDLLNAIIIYLATLLIAIPAGAMVIVSNIMLTIFLGIGPVFIAMLMFSVTAKWFDSWIGQVMTYILQIALITTVLGMGMKFFNALTQRVLANPDDYPIATLLEILIVTGVTLFLLQRAYEAAAGIAGGISSAGLTLRQAMNPAYQMVNGQSTRRDLQSGMMVTAGRTNHLLAGNTIANPAYSQHVMQNLGKNWGRARGGSVKQ